MITMDTTNFKKTFFNLLSRQTLLSALENFQNDIVYVSKDDEISKKLLAFYVQIFKATVCTITIQDEEEKKRN